MKPVPIDPLVSIAPPLLRRVSRKIAQSPPTNPDKQCAQTAPKKVVPGHGYSPTSIYDTPLSSVVRIIGTDHDGPVPLDNRVGLDFRLANPPVLLYDGRV